ncbi:MFS general substrate transporter, partial [Atractiella rhizophila]
MMSPSPTPQPRVTAMDLDGKSIKSLGIDDTLDRRDDPASSALAMAAGANIDASIPPCDATFKKRSMVSRALDGWKFTGKEWACFFTLVVAGISDASAGALIPYMQSYFHIGYMTVSTLFVGQCIGFILASFSNAYLTDKFGLGTVIAWGAFQQTIAYTLMAPPINFPLIVVCYAINGFGMALQDAAANAYIGGTGGNVAWKMGLLHAFYGLGALISPLIATAFVSSGIKFSYFWLVTLGLGVVNFLLLLSMFRLERESAAEDSSERQEGQEMAAVGVRGMEEGNMVVQEDDHKAKLKRILTDRNVLVMAAFILLYVGTEVSIG